MAEGTKKPKVKETSTRVLVAQIECTMRQEKKTHFRFFTFPKNEKLRGIWENRVARKSGKDGFRNNQGNCGLQRPFSSRWHIACSRGESVNCRERSIPTKIEWTVEEDEKKRKVPGQREASLNCKQVTAKKLERRSLIQTVVHDVRDSTVGKCESRFTPYLSVLGPVQTSNFTSAEPNTSLDRPKLLSSTVDSDGRTLHVPNLIRGEKKYHP